MRFLILNTDYDLFLRALYQDVGLRRAPYAEQMAARAESLFGVADFYSDGLRGLGHDASDVYLNNVFAQAAWARENGLDDVAALAERGDRDGTKVLRARRRLAALMGIGAATDLQRALAEIFAAQVEAARPDVLIVQDVGMFDAQALKRLRRNVGMLVAQVPWLASSGAARDDLDRFFEYDLVLSSAQPTVDNLTSRGVPAILHRLGFDPRVRTSLMRPQVRYEVVFVGGLSGLHGSRVELLEFVSRRVEGLQIWAPSLDGVAKDSPIRGHYNGQAWGRKMYEILASSRIALNDQTPVAPYANNMRLFEATGVGTLLLTDRLAGLGDLFDAKTEVATYGSPAECVDELGRLLSDEATRAEIASAGQRRTLASHTYRQRMRELLEILSRVS